jgi:hypothetical protein
VRQKYLSRWSGNFKAPKRMMRWLEERLAGETYAVQAATVAVMCMRVWCSPGRIGEEFALSRTDVARKLGLREWETRKGIELLVAVGFLSAKAPESLQARRTAKGIRRPPILYRVCLTIVSYFRRLLEKRSAPVFNLSEGNLPKTEGLYSGVGPADIKKGDPEGPPAHTKRKHDFSRE